MLQPRQQRSPGCITVDDDKISDDFPAGMQLLGDLIGDDATHRESKQSVRTPWLLLANDLDVFRGQALDGGSILPAGLCCLLHGYIGGEYRRVAGQVCREWPVQLHTANAVQRRPIAFQLQWNQ